MLRIINYNSGDLELVTDGATVRIEREAANRFVMAARMHTIESFLTKLPKLIANKEIVALIIDLIETADGSARWNVKETFARLHTVVPGHAPERPDEVCEEISL